MASTKNTRTTLQSTDKGGYSALRTIGISALAVAIATSTWFLGVIVDMCAIVTGGTDSPTGFEESDLTRVLSIVSLSALIVAIACAVVRGALWVTSRK